MIPRARGTVSFENVDLTIFCFLQYVFKKNFWMFYNALCSLFSDFINKNLFKA